MMCLGQWQAFVEAGETRQQQYARLQKAPEHMQPAIIGHMQTIKAIRAARPAPQPID